MRFCRPIRAVKGSPPRRVIVVEGNRGVPRADMREGLLVSSWPGSLPGGEGGDEG